jgi:hypothetical protein
VSERIAPPDHLTPNSDTIRKHGTLRVMLVAARKWKREKSHQNKRK